MPSAKRHPRLDQLLASLGYGSRKDIDIAVKAGRITVEGVDQPRSSERYDPKLVRFDDLELDAPEGLLILLHKPCGYICSHNEEEGQSVYELLPPRWNIRSPKVVSIGRLDKDSSGLLLLTDQHDLVHALTSPKKQVEKVYDVELDDPVTEEMVKIFASGTLLLKGDDKACLPAKLEILAERKARVTLSEGRYRQIRRMFAMLNTRVLALHRHKFGRLELGDLPEAEFRTLSPVLDSVIA